MLKHLASYILYLLVLIVILFTGSVGVAPQWAPERKDLEVMSLQSAIIVNGATLLLIIGLVYLIVRAVQI
jgi:hypothetical protein